MGKCASLIRLQIQCANHFVTDLQWGHGFAFGERQGIHRQIVLIGAHIVDNHKRIVTGTATHQSFAMWHPQSQLVRMRRSTAHHLLGFLVNQEDADEIIAEGLAHRFDQTR